MAMAATLFGDVSAPSHQIPVRPHTVGSALPGHCTMGHLTDRGLMQAYAQGLRLGAHLKTLYAARGTALETADIDARSTDYHRTRATTMGVLSGVVNTAIALGPGEKGRLPAVVYRDGAHDYLPMSDRVCKASAYVKEAYAAAEWVDYVNATMPALQTAVDGIAGADKTDVSSFFDCVKTRLCHQKPLPDAYTEALDTQLSDYMDKYWNQVFFHDHPRAARLFSGGVLLVLYAELSRVLAAGAAALDARPSVVLRGGHDFGPMMNLCSALDLGNKRASYWPPYVSMLNLEIAAVPAALAHTASRIGVRAILNGEGAAMGVCTGHTEAGAFCPLETLIAALEPMLPSAEECPGLVPEPEFLEALTAAGGVRALRSGAAGGRIVGAETAAKLDAFAERAQAAARQDSAVAEQLPRTRTDEEVWAARHFDL